MPVYLVAQLNIHDRETYARYGLLEFPSSEDLARAWYGSEEYQAIAQHRRAASVANLVLIGGR